ncbi:MAG TPA: hypothetical protein VG387_06825 [Rhizomicrobium sp.]|jgi:hypothetical protein|nr:hypothetical protein [Rhizomicrobium sp.]
MQIFPRGQTLVIVLLSAAALGMSQHIIESVSWAATWMSVLQNIFAGFFVLWVQEMVSARTAIARPAVLQPAPSTAVETTASQNDYATVLYTAGTQLAALSLLNIIHGMMISNIGQLVKSGGLRFAPHGYDAIQIEVGATLTLAIWLPALIILGFALGRSARNISPMRFLAGSLLSIPIYSVLSGGLDDPNDVLRVLKMNAPEGGMGPAEWAIVLFFRVATSLFIALVAAIVPWLIASAVRFLSGLVARRRARRAFV